MGKSKNTVFKGSPRVTMDKCLGAVNLIESEGMSIYDVCVAKELEVAMASYMKRSRSLSSRSSMVSDKDSLFGLALEVFSKSGGASTPKDVAEQVVSAYVKCGCDMPRTEMYARTWMFALVDEGGVWEFSW